MDEWLLLAALFVVAVPVGYLLGRGLGLLVNWLGGRGR